MNSYTWKRLRLNGEDDEEEANQKKEEAKKKKNVAKKKKKKPTRAAVKPPVKIDCAPSIEHLYVRQTGILLLR